MVSTFKLETLLKAGIDILNNYVSKSTLRKEFSTQCGIGGNIIYLVKLPKSDRSLQLVTDGKLKSRGEYWLSHRSSIISSFGRSKALRKFAPSRATLRMYNRSPRDTEVKAGAGADIVPDGP
jgi:hypothetical protein